MQPNNNNSSSWGLIVRAACRHMWRARQKRICKPWIVPDNCTTPLRTGELVGDYWLCRQELDTPGVRTVLWHWCAWRQWTPWMGFLSPPPSSAAPTRMSPVNENADGVFRHTAVALSQSLLCTVAKLQKTTISVVMSVCPHGITRPPLDGFSWNLIFEYFSKICVGNPSFIKIWQE
jgi:hypothetical protein